MSLKGKGGFMAMILSVLGVVLWVTMFSTILDGIGTLWETSGISNFIAFGTVLRIAPTILFLGGVFAAGVGYYKGYKSYGSKDTGGLTRMVFGVLEIVLFVTLFATIISSMSTLYSSANSTWIAFGTTVSIAPTILFLAGIFAGGATAYGGYKARKRRRA